jgi:hypothetical protein
MKRAKLIYRELKNYLYLRQVIREESSKVNSPWNNFKLRANWYGRIYTVISLREEDMGEEEAVIRWKAMEVMRPINEYLTTLDLQEIIFPSIEAIPETRSFLVVYSPLFKQFTVGWVFTRILIPLITIVALSLYL